MKKSFLCVIFMLLSTAIIFAAISITNIDISDFPKINVYTVSDESDISSVKDNGILQKIVINNLSESKISKADVVFVFDTTGSMNEEITDLKNGLVDFANTIKKAKIDLRMGLVTFGDEIRNIYSLTYDIEDFKKKISDLSVNGGGDDPELSLDALIKTPALSFRSDSQKIIVLVTDAPYHDKNDGSGLSKFVVSDLTKLYQELGITMIAVAPSAYSGITDTLNGLFIDINKEKNFAKVMTRISATISKQSVISYRVEDTTPDKIHDVVLSSTNSARDSYKSPSAVNVTLSSIEVQGIGVIPEKLSDTPKGIISARLSGIADAQKQILEILLGVKLSGSETVEDGILKDFRLLTSVKGITSGSMITGEEYRKDMGVYFVKMKLDLVGDNSLISAVRNAKYYNPSTSKELSDKFSQFVNGAIKAVGFGILDSKISKGQALYKARNAAIADCQLRLLESLKGFNLESNVTLEDVGKSNTVITKKIEGVIKGAQVINEKTITESAANSDGLYMVEMAVNLDEKVGIIGTIINEIGIPKTQKVTEEFTKKEIIKNTEPEKTDKTPEAIVTGLIIEVSNMGLMPALMPRIISEDGKVIYSVESVSEDVAPVIQYEPTIIKARKNETCGANPYILNAKEVKGSDIVITKDDAMKIKKMLEKRNFFLSASVVAVVGG